MKIKIVLLTAVLIFYLTSPAFACVPQTQFIYPLNVIILLAFTGVLFYRRFHFAHIVYYLGTAFFLGFLAPAIPIFLSITLPVGIVFFFEAMKLGRLQKSTRQTLPSNARWRFLIPIIFSGWLILSAIFPLFIIPGILAIIFITSLKTSNERPENLPPPAEEVPAVQKSIALVIFVLVFLSIPVYAVYLGTSPHAVILFFSLLLLVLALVFLRSFIRRTGIPREEWISRVFTSALLFLAVALITFSLKMNTSFGASMDNYINMLWIKKAEFLLLFLALLPVPVIFLYDEFRARRKLAALKV